jgi:hypothetical protein
MHRKKATANQRAIGACLSEFLPDNSATPYYIS